MTNHISTNMDVQIKIFMSKVVLVLALCPVFRIKSSVFNIEELQNSKYGVEITGEPVLLNQVTDETVMQITSKHGQQYQCVLPVLHVESEEKNSKNITREEINDLLEPFNSTCLYLLNNWWTYKVCFGRSVFQYHEEGNKVMDNSSLGYYTGDTDWSQVTLSEENTGSQKRYHSQFYSNGTLCDLTGELRKTEVRFFCDPQGSDYIARIDESSTCIYIITVYTNKLCNHSLFRPAESPKKHSITCSPALKEEQFKKYTEAKRRTEEDVSNDDFSSKKSEGDEDEDEEEMNEKPRKPTPSIFEAVAKLFYKAGEKEKNTQVGINGESKTDKEEKIDWKDVLKTSRDAIDKSIERLRKLRFHKKFEDKTDETEDGTDAETKSKIKQHLMKGRKAVSNNYLYNIEKETASKESKYNLIDGLKIQYRFFKKQIEIVTKDLHEKLKKLENDADDANPVVAKLVERIKASIRRFEENQRTLDEQMKRLGNLNEAVVNDPNYPKAKEDIAAIKSRLTKLMEDMMPKTNGDGDDDLGKDKNERLVNRIEDIGKHFESQNSVKESRRKDGFFDMESPKLDRVVSKLKKIMTHEAVDEDFENDKQTTDGDIYDDDRISVRVTKIKDEIDDETDESSYAVNDEKEEINENKEMKAATKKMENIVHKQLQEAGIKHEGKIKVKIITSKDTLKRVAGGNDGFQILTPQETTEFRDLLSNLLGGNREFQEEKERQEKLEDNYNLVWNHGGFASVKKESSNEHEDSDETT